MSLSETIQKDIVTAMKSKEEMKLGVLRMVKAAIQLKEVEKLRSWMIRSQFSCCRRWSNSGRNRLTSSRRAEGRI